MNTIICRRMCNGSLNMKLYIDTLFIQIYQRLHARKLREEKKNKNQREKEKKKRIKSLLMYVWTAFNIDICV